MRSWFALFITLVLVTGCAVSSINVLEKKDTPKPFSRIMVVYVDNDIGFSVFDSLTYDICIRPAFMGPAGPEVIGNTENLICDGLSSPRSAFVRSSDYFDTTYNYSVNVGASFWTPNAAFGCYLIRPHEFLPVWRAEVDVKGKGYINGKHVLRTDMIDKLEKTLVIGGYIAPHRLEYTTNLKQ